VGVWSKTVVRRNDEKPLPPPLLLISKEEAIEKISKQIERGSQFKNSEITSMAELKNAQRAFYTWNDFNEELLTRMFDNPSIRDGYRKSFGIGHVGTTPLTELIEEFRDDVDYYLRKLESIRSRVGIIEESPILLHQSPIPSTKRAISKNVFIVHGHDEEAKEAVARCIHKLDLNPIILNERPNTGKTIIEKFESSSEDIGFAVVLLTPDDIGYTKNKPEEIKPRARQNVILELGYFVAKLGRERVCALHKRDQDGKDIEIPSDYHGVIFLPMDSNWRFQLAQEIKQVIRDIDLNKLF